MRVLSFLLYSLTDDWAFEEGQVWAPTCEAALRYLLAGLREGWAIHVLSCGIAT